MSSFTTRLEVSPEPDGRHWRLLRTFGYDVGHKDSAERITVPAGFKTDFASSPPQIWWLIPPWGKYGKAAVVHDCLYQNQGYLSHDTLLRHLRTRKWCDSVFLEAMEVLGVTPWRRRLMYWGVRIFGGLAWR